MKSWVKGKVELEKCASTTLTKKTFSWKFGFIQCVSQTKETAPNGFSSSHCMKSLLLKKDDIPEGTNCLATTPTSDESKWSAKRIPRCFGVQPTVPKISHSSRKSWKLDAIARLVGLTSLAGFTTGRFEPKTSWIKAILRSELGIDVDWQSHGFVFDGAFSSNIDAFCFRLCVLFVWTCAFVVLSFHSYILMAPKCHKSWHFNFSRFQ